MNHPRTSLPMIIALLAESDRRFRVKLKYEPPTVREISPEDIPADIREKLLKSSTYGKTITLDTDIQNHEDAKNHYHLDL